MVLRVCIIVFTVSCSTGYVHGVCVLLYSRYPAQQATCMVCVYLWCFQIKKINVAKFSLLRKTSTFNRQEGKNERTQEGKKRRVNMERGKANTMSSRS